MLPRIREITDAFGARLRVSVEAHPGGALVVIERPDSASMGHAMLDGYGADVLASYIMSARLSVPHGLPEEHVDGKFGARFELALAPRAALEIVQQGREPLEIPSPFWDRLYAELGLVAAHARELGRRSRSGMH